MKFDFMDNPVFEGLGKIVDCVWLSLLWLLSCVPIFTIGASTSALCYAVHKSVREGREYPTKCFFHAFKENFKQGTAVWLVWLVIFTVFVLDSMITREITYVFYFFIVMIALAVIWLCYLLPYVAKFENTVKQTLKNALILMAANPLWSVLLPVILVLAAAAIWFVPVTLAVMPAAVALLHDFIMQRIFVKYIPAED